MKRVFTPAKKRTILIVDDDSLGGRIYAENLEAGGFKVEMASRSENALEALQRGIVDLAVVDLSLPGMDTIELIKTIRRSANPQAPPVIALSNPYLRARTRAANEAGANRCVTKIDCQPEQLIELARELGVSATRPASDRIEMAEMIRRKSIAGFFVNESETIAKLRGSHQPLARAQDEESRNRELIAMHRHLRVVTGGASLLRFSKIARLSAALEGLLVELRDKPAKVTPSAVRTIAQAIDALVALFRQAKSAADETSSSKTLVVDDEAISREAVCSALAKAGIEPVGLEDPFAAQQLLENERFDLVFLDVEMPGQSGLDLCVKIREMETNRTTPIVFVTSHSDFGSRAQSTLSGGNDFISKPFLLVELALKALIWLFKDTASSRSSPSISPTSAADTPEPRPVEVSHQESEAAAD